jgi:hypothetical protein
MTVSQALLVHRILPRILLYLKEPGGGHLKSQRKGPLDLHKLISKSIFVICRGKGVVVTTLTKQVINQLANSVQDRAHRTVTNHAAVYNLGAWQQQTGQAQLQANPPRRNAQGAQVPRDLSTESTCDQGAQDAPALSNLSNLSTPRVHRYIGRRRERPPGPPWSTQVLPQYRLYTLHLVTLATPSVVCLPTPST